MHMEKSQSVHMVKHCAHKFATLCCCLQKLILKQLELEGEVPSVGFSAELQAPL